ncbi:MAG: YkgJ family cysteine cluster protein [Candidatus Eremiobacteraeota bacterium]|nr:YkgJ family cysteine cluster protein [Candidatus Eremiobacteraeota bacterium]
MEIHSGTIIELDEYSFSVKNLVFQGDQGEMDEVLLYYADYPPVRDEVRKLVRSVLCGFREILFPSMDDTAAPGRLIADLAYVTLQGDVITAVASSQKFVRERMEKEPLASRAARLKDLLAAIGGPQGKNRPSRESPGIPPAPSLSQGSSTPDLAALLTCARCGRCCRQFEVVVSLEDMDRIATNLNIIEAELKAAYLKPDCFTWNEDAMVLKKSNQSLWRREKPPCIFLKKGKGREHLCSIHEARPAACRRYVPGTAQCLRNRGSC